MIKNHGIVDMTNHLAVMVDHNDAAACVKNLSGFQNIAHMRVADDQ